MSSSKFPKFKSTYEPKTAYGRDVVKPYYENNLTPSVNWMMGGNAEHKQKYGSDYGSEDVEAISREYVLWRDANGISANYNKGLMPWVEQVRASAAQGGIPGAAVPYTPPVAATPVGAANTVNPTALSQGNAMQGTIKPAVKPMAQTGRNGVVTQNYAAGTQGTAVGVSASDGQGTVAAAQNNGAVANNAGAEVTSPSTQVSAPVGQNNAAVGGTATAQTGKSDALWSADSFYAQIAKNKAIDNAKLDGSGLPAATVEALKAQSGLDNVGKNYQAAVKQAETDYARAQSRFGQNAEYLAQSGLSNSGFSDASDNAAYAAMQRAKVAAGENALAAQAEGQKTLWQRVAEEQTKLKAETQARESELLSFVTTKGLGGQEAINYLTANGMDAARAADLVASQVDPIYNANLDKAAAAYIDAIRKGALPKEAELILGANGYGAMAPAAVEKAKVILDSEEYKAQQGKTEAKSTAEGLVWYEDNKKSYSEEYLQNYLEAQGYDYEDVKTKYDEAQVGKLDYAFERLGQGDTAGASNGLKSVLNISDEEWSTAYNEGNIGDLLRSKADVVYSTDVEMRSKVYAQSVVYALKTNNDNEFIAMLQANVDEWARQGILTEKDLDTARTAMNNSLRIGGVVNATEGMAYQDTGFMNQAMVRFGVNGEIFNIDVNKLDSRPQVSSGWTSIGKTRHGAELRVAVSTQNGKEVLVFMSVNSDGSVQFLQSDIRDNLNTLEMSGMGQEWENELYNALVNKFKTSGKTSSRSIKSNK